ncbi:hypothetical protein CPB84DRAFT_1854417 [Gymnopilus junonius]|uniref:non-specific serine/threonine protein kinase n=1 Tax=Gymnopilus junonius TaxID=109634 RepID=A0A9P5TGM1_GYMJU|nr:hypothetical protein CPB84DRAFT_1854417 [Gymnopilus junonius]
MTTRDPNVPETWAEVEVRLADLGVACWADDIPGHFTDLIYPLALRAPEVCTGAGWGKPSDIWSLECAVFQLVLGQSLIKPDVIPESTPYIHTALLVDYPAQMVKRGKYSHLYFEKDGPLNIPLPGRTSLKKRV